MARRRDRSRLRTYERRHPTLVRRVSWLRHHRRISAVAVSAGILATFGLSLMLSSEVVTGLYLVPLTLVAIIESEVLVAGAGAGCALLSVIVLRAQGHLDAQAGLLFAYGGLYVLGLVVLAYLVNRLTRISHYAELRAQMAEASADVTAVSGNRADLAELLQYAVERIGGEVGASAGLVLLLRQEEWTGLAGYGLGADARVLRARFAEAPVAVQALETNKVTVVVPGDGDACLPVEITARLGLGQLLVAPMRAFGNDVGVIVFNRARDMGPFTVDEVRFAESLAHYTAVAIANVQLMAELSARQHDLELVRDSSLDFAASLDMGRVLESVVMRLVNTLGMDACDLYRLEPDGEHLALLVSYDDQHFDVDEFVGRSYSLTDFASAALVVRTRRPVQLHSLDDPRLSPEERRQFELYGYRMQLSMPLRIRNRIIGLVELYDAHEARELPVELVELASAICRFAALAIDNAELYDAERVTAERLNLLTRQLTTLQAVVLSLNERLDRADPQEILEDVTRAGAALLGARAAAVVTRDARGVRVRALHVNGDGDDAAGGGVTRLVAAESLPGSLSALADDGDAGFAGEGLPAGGQVGDDLLVVPLESGKPGRTAVLAFADKEAGPFSESDRLLAATLAAHASASLRNTLSFQHEHEIAETFQNALRMEPWPISGLDVGVCYNPATDAARVGGDFYDLVPLGPGRLMVAVGDVCGKGLPAAAQTAVARYMLRAYAAEGSPGEALSRLNAAMIAQDDTQPFVTLVVAYVDVGRRMFEYAVAGHPRPLVQTGDGQFAVPRDGSFPLGVFRGAVYPTNRVVLPEASTVVLFTDGIVDARQGRELFGEGRLLEAVGERLDRPAAELAQELVTLVRDFAGGSLDDDGVTVVLKLS